MTMPPVSTNYAEQVLREEAERLAELKENAVSRMALEAKKAEEVKGETCRVKVNLNDEDNFPTLGKVKVTAPVWTNSNVAPVVVPKPAATAATSTSPTNSNNSSIRFILPQEHQRKDINISVNVNSTCARVMKDTDTTIEVSVSGQSKAISFVLSGKSDNIKAAKRQLWSLLAQNGAIEFDVPEECLKFIIGPSGKVLKEIETSCAVKVKIPRGEDWKGFIIVSGDFEGVAMARDKILSIVQERANKATHQIEIERTLAPFLWVKELSGISQEELAELFPSVKISLIKSVEGSAMLNLTGDKNQIESIQGLVSQSLIRLRSSIKSVSTFVPKALHRLLIGPKGSVLHQLEDETGCEIFVPSAKDEPENQQVTIYGPEDKLLLGLSSLMDKFKGMASEKISIPEISYKLIDKIAKYRNELKSFDPDVSIHYNSSNLSIEVDGKKENVLNFINFLKSEILSKLSAYKVQESLEVDQEYLKHVIGRKGHNLQQIQKDYQVEIIIEDVVYFIGLDAESVRKAKDHINSILSNIIDILSITARVDSKYHGILIGAKGSNLASYHEKYPSVMINFLNDEITFKGPKSEVEPCHQEMMQQADSVRHESIMNSYTQTVDIAPAVSKSSRDCAFLINFARQNDCKLTIEDTAATLKGSKKSVDHLVPLLKAQIALIQDRDSLTFTVDPQYHGILIGSEGRNLKHLIQKYSVSVVFPRNLKENDESVSEEQSNENMDDIIKIIGPKTNIVKARDELLDLLKYHLAHGNQEIMKIPSKAVPYLIGKSGVTIDRIKLESDCKIDFSTGHDDKFESEVKLGGTIESIKSARDLINQHVKDFMAQDEQGVKVPESLLSTFKMEYRKITQKYSKDDLMFYARENNSLIRIKGKKELVHSAVVELESLINLIETGSLIKNELFVPSRIHGKILGVEASNIKELIKEFDCDIQVPKFGQTGPVILIGPLENVQKCSDIIQSYCIEERLYKFPSASAKTSFLNSEKSSPILSQLKEWKQHPYGIILIGEIDQIEQVKREIQELEL